MPKLNMERMRAEAERIRLEEQLQAASDRFCENCRERFDGDEVWVNMRSRHPDDDDPVKEYYCRKCIKVDPSRTKQPEAGPSWKS